MIISYDKLSKEFCSQFDSIVLTAGQSSPSLSHNLLEVVYNDVLSFSYLVKIIEDNQKLIYMSSAALYGDTAGRIVNENENIIVNNYYDLGKQIRDTVCILNNESKQIYGLRIGTLAGAAPITRTDLIVNKMVHDAQTSEKISVSVDNVNRSIISVNDLCRVIHTIILSGNLESSGVYNICSFNSDAKSIASHIINHFPDTQITELKQEYSSPYSFLLDTSHFCDTFGFTFNSNIDDIIEDLKNNLPKVQQSISQKTKEVYNLTNKCRVCETHTSELLNLGYQPLANNYHSQNEQIEWYPLCLHYCSNCFHVQLNCTVDPEILFKNYLYVSGTSKTGKRYFYEFARRTIERLRKLGRLNESQIRVLDIACNDGSQLDAFKQVCEEEGIDVLTIGVDPAKNLYETSVSKGHKIHCDFFDDTLGESLKSMYGDFHIIIAQNVFAHVDSPGHFLDGCLKLMNDDSVVYIQTSQAKMIENSEWDTAYHEHLSFFNSNSMNVLCKKRGVCLNRIDLTPIHGTSYVFEITKNTTEDSNTIDVIYDELTRGLYDEETYRLYTYKCQIYKNDFHNQLLKYKLEGYDIVAFGSTAKFNTLLNSVQIDNTVIDFIVDENTLKQGLLTPGSNIPVVPSSFISTITDKTVIIVSAWNFYNEIKEKVLGLLERQLENIKLLNVNPLQEEVLA
jgi:nucleoside-diphosphate-sugar epimerase/SAM-dependent methyltransferase